jgi:hypothetical protein
MQLPKKHAPAHLPVCACDPSLRLNNGSGRDDADHKRELYYYPRSKIRTNLMIF